jgi:hypothetical protein
MHTHSTKKNTKYSQFFAALSTFKKLGYEGDRSTLIYEFSKGKYSSLSELSPHDYKELLIWMNTKRSELQSSTAEIETRQKRKVIALFCQMGYKVDNKADMDRINEWCTTHGHLKTHLNGYAGEDLSKLVYQAERVYKSFINGI